MIPRRPSPDDIDGPNARRYYAFVLALFKAYRTSPVPPGMALHEAYVDWRTNILPLTGPDMTAFILSVLDNFEHEHHSRDHARESYNRARRERRARGVPDAADGDDSDATNDPNEDDAFRPPRDQPADADDGETNVNDEVLLPQPDDADDDSTATAQLSQFDLHHANLHDLFNADTSESRYALNAVSMCSQPELPSGGPALPKGFVLHGSPDTAAAIKRATRELEVFDAEGGQLTAGDDFQVAAVGCSAPVLHLRKNRHSVVAVVTGPDPASPEHGIVERELPRGTLPPLIALAQPPSVEDTVQLFTLSIEQAVPFMLLAQYFDKRHAINSPRPPRILVVGGQGSGKSQFAQAVLWYTFQHGVPQWLSTCAFAWSAALAFATPHHRSLSTHTMFQLVPPNRLKNGAAHQVRANIGTGALLIDEIGYNSLEHLGACNQSANSALDNSRGVNDDDPALQTLRGLPYCLVGDVYQHTQPNGKPVYSWAQDIERDPRFVPAQDTQPAGAATARAGAAAKRISPAAQTLILSGYKLYRGVEDVFLLTTQQRQDNSEDGRLLTRLSQMFNGERPPNHDDIALMVDKLNAQAVTDLASLAHSGPRVVSQRNAPRHVLNTRLLQMAAMRAAKRLVVWNAEHVPVRSQQQLHPPPLTPLTKLRALLQCDEKADGLTADTWYFDGALFILSDTSKAHGAAAGACRNNLVRAAGLVTDPREPPDSGTGPFWRLKYLPQAVLVTPVKAASDAGVFRDQPAFAEVQNAFPVCPRLTKAPMSVETLDASGATTRVQVKRRNVPLNDAYVVTDFFVQGCSFKDDCWVVDLMPPPTGIKRACLFVLLTRFKSLAHIRLLRPLYEGRASREAIIKAFTKAATISPDLAAETRLQREAAQQTLQRHAALFDEAARLVAARTST
jgi:hypothetical protein